MKDSVITDVRETEAAAVSRWLEALDAVEAGADALTVTTKASAASSAPGFEALADATPLRIKTQRMRSDDRTILILRPESTPDAQAAIRALRALSRPYVVTAGRSNVIGTFEDAPGLVVSTEGLTGVVEFDGVSQTVTVGAGMYGGKLEAWLHERGFSIGQLPQSLYISTVGGWVATRATGSLSARNGGIESAVLGATVVLPDGSVATFGPRVRPAGGFDGLSMFVGAEGSFGVVTEVTLRVHRILPETMLCLAFDSLADNIAAQRELMQGGYPVALLRGYNPAESAHILGDAITEGECLLLVSTTGPDDLLASQREAIVRRLTELGGQLLADDAADRWFDERFKVETMMADRNAVPGKAFDTIEASVMWSRAVDCIAALERVLSARTRKLYIHFSHAYSAGVGFYLLLWLEDEDDPSVVAALRACWEEALRIIERHGGTVGHHHGIGSVRSSAYRQLPDARLHTRIKSVLDPEHLLYARLLRE